MNAPQPLELEKTDQRELVIRWSDGLEQQLPFRVLRSACQCATCMEKKTKPPISPGGALPVLSAAETLPLDVTSMRPVGNYAYNINFSDGHSTGIFTFDLIRSLEP